MNEEVSAEEIEREEMLQRIAELEFEIEELNEKAKE